LPRCARRARASRSSCSPDAGTSRRRAARTAARRGARSPRSCAGPASRSSTRPPTCSPTASIGARRPGCRRATTRRPATPASPSCSNPRSRAETRRRRGATRTWSSTRPATRAGPVAEPRAASREIRAELTDPGAIRRMARQADPPPSPPYAASHPRPRRPPPAAACATLAAAALLPAPPLRPYRVIDLGAPIGQDPRAGVLADGMSASSEYVAGTSVWEPFVWRRGSGMQALQKLPGYVSAGALAVSDAGLAVGRCGLSTGSWEPYQAVAWDPSGAVTSLQQPGWRHSLAVDINNHHQVLLSVGLATGISTWKQHAFTGPLGGPYVEVVPGAVSAAYDLNDRGQIVLSIDSVRYARFTPGIGLESLPIVPWCLNEYGQVAGTQQAVARFTDGTGVHVFPGTTNFRDVGGIDSFGQVVATEYVRTSQSPPRYAYYGYLLSDALGVRKLDDLVDQSVPVRVEQVVAIGDDGTIAASGSVGQRNRAMLLEPRFVHVHGNGCSGSNGTPRAIAVGSPTGGQRVTLLGAGGVGHGNAAFVLGFAATSLPMSGGCTLLVDPAGAFVVPVALNPIGQGSLALDVPVGVTGALFAQFVTIDPNAPNSLFAASNGVRIDVQ